LFSFASSELAALTAPEVGLAGVTKTVTVCGRLREVTIVCTAADDTVALGEMAALEVEAEVEEEVDTEVEEDVEEMTVSELITEAAARSFEELGGVPTTFVPFVPFHTTGQLSPSRLRSLGTHEHM